MDAAVRVKIDKRIDLIPTFSYTRVLLAATCTMTFDEQMDMTLINAYNQRKTIMDCNDRTVQANARRNSAWMEIAVEVNALSSIKKSKDQVISRYKYLTSKAKRKNVDKKRHVKGTGGGPPMKLDPVSVALIENNADDPSYSCLEGAVESVIDQETNADNSSENLPESNPAISG